MFEMISVCPFVRSHSVTVEINDLIRVPPHLHTVSNEWKICPSTCVPLRYQASSLQSVYIELVEDSRRLDLGEKGRKSNRFGENFVYVNFYIGYSGEVSTSKQCQQRYH